MIYHTWENCPGINLNFMPGLLENYTIYLIIDDLNSFNFFKSKNGRKNRLKGRFPDELYLDHCFFFLVAVVVQ